MTQLRKKGVRSNMSTPTKWSRKRTVKAWVIVTGRGFSKVESADYFVENDCYCCDETQALAVYKTKDEADTMNSKQDTHLVVPILITLPTKTGKK